MLGGEWTHLTDDCQGTLIMTPNVMAFISRHSRVIVIIIVCMYIAQTKSNIKLVGGA